MRELVPLGLIAAFCWLGAPADARAHVESPPESLGIVLVPDDEVALGIEASFGLLLAPDGDRWFWVCHEAIVPQLAPVFPHYVRNADGVILAVGGIEVEREGRMLSLHRSPEGCEWELPEGLDGALVADAAFDPGDGSRALAVTASLGDGVLNSIALSVDAGRTWSRQPMERAGRFFRSLAWSADTDDVVWAASNWYDPAGSWLLNSEDGGATWQEVPLVLLGDDGEVWTDPDVEAAVGARTVFVSALRPAGGEVLLRSDDGGESLDLILQSEEPIWNVLTSDGERVLVTTSGGQLFRAVDGRTFERVDSAPPTRSIGADSRGLFLGAGIEQDVGLGLSQDDGSTMVPVMSFLDLEGILPCPADSETAVVCDAFWGSLSFQLGLWDPPTDDDDSAPAEEAPPTSQASCAGCASSFAGGARWFGVLSLLVLSGARRRRPGHSTSGKPLT